MNRILACVAVLLGTVAVVVVGQSEKKDAASGAPSAYTNPIISGDWSDPGVIRVGTDYYSVRSTFGWQPGLHIAHSRDLLHWEYIGHGFTSHPKLLPGDTRLGIWGSEIGWNPNTKQFLIYAPTRDGEVFVYYADTPEGPYQVKSLGAKLGIDPGFFADEDGTLYFLTNRALIHELSPDGLSLKRPVVQVDRTPYKLFEGPDIFKHGGWYYLLFSDGGTLPHEPSTISTLRARTIEGPWEPDPGNPVMFATDGGTRFEGPAHGTLIDTPSGEWYLGYHAHEPAYYTLGRQFLLEPIEWTADGWWRPAGGKVPSTSAKAPALAPVPLQLRQSDEFDAPDLGLQWFFTCAPDLSGRTWSLREQPGVLRIRTQPGDLHELTALPGVFQQRVIDKAFAFETRVTFDAREGREAAGLHMFHDPLMNLWLATTVRDGRKEISVGRHTLGVREDLWSEPNPYGDHPVHLRIVVTDPETVTFFHSADGRDWRPIGEALYVGASGHHLRDGRRGDPDLGWVGRYKERGVPPIELNGLPEHQRQAQRGGNLWTGATFGVFAVQDGASSQKTADFEYLRVISGQTPRGPGFVAAPPEPEGLLSREVVELWPVGRVPGASGVTATRRVQERGTDAAHDRAITGVTRPMLEVFRPEKPNGAAMVILPGGAYVRLAIDKEGAGGARRMTQAGITSFVLNYRLPADKWEAGYDAALQDAQRAVRLVRANAATWGLDPRRIGVMGFSAGGHLAAALLTRYDAEVYEAVDAADQQSARADVVMLGYSFNVVGSRPIGTIPVSAETSRPLHERVRAGLAPTFLVHAADDRTVPVTNSLDMFRALKAAGVPAELHIYQEGGHGFGFSLAADRPASRWPDAFEAWLRRLKFI